MMNLAEKMLFKITWTRKRRAIALLTKWSHWYAYKPAREDRHFNRALWEATREFLREDKPSHPAWKPEETFPEHLRKMGERFKELLGKDGE